MAVTVLVDDREPARLVESLLAASEEEFLSVEGISPKRAAAIHAAVRSEE